MTLRGEAEANRSEIPHCVRNKLRNLAFSEEIATVENDLAMTDAIDTCNSYRWNWVIFFCSVIAQLDWAIQKKELDYPVKSDADLREEALRPDNDNHWNRVRYE